MEDIYTDCSQEINQAVHMARILGKVYETIQGVHELQAFVPIGDSKLKSKIIAAKNNSFEVPVKNFIDLAGFLIEQAHGLEMADDSIYKKSQKNLQILKNLK